MSKTHLTFRFIVWVFATLAIPTLSFAAVSSIRPPTGSLNPGGSAFVYSTFLSGGLHEFANAIAIDFPGNVYVGNAASNNFPRLFPLRDVYGGGRQDAFVSKIGSFSGPTLTPTPTPLPTPKSASAGDLVISQIYGGGGTAGATYHNSYVEIFNRSSSPIITHAYAIAMGLGTGPVDRSFGKSSSQGIVIQPGQHLLVRMGSGGANGAALPQPDLDVQSSSPSSFFGLSGKLALTGETANNSIFADCPLAAQSLLDLVGFGATNCYEGSGPIGGLSVTTAALRNNNGCSDTNDNASDFTIGAPNPRNSSSPLAPCATSTPLAKARFDFDGDGKSDESVFRPSNDTWYLNRSQAGFTGYQFGVTDDLLTPADFTGDGKTDVAVFRPSSGTWFVLKSEDNTFYGTQFGANGDIPAPGDYDGDGKADTAVFRPLNGTWFIQGSTTGFTATQFGTNGDVPTVGDFDGDGKSDVAVFRPSNGTWFRLNSSNGAFVGTQFGQNGDKVVAADYTGDGKTDLAVWRPSEGTWYIQKSEDNSFYGVQFGMTGDLPTPGDYDGDGKADVAVFRPSSGTWFEQRSTTGFAAVQFGVSGDKPAPNAFIY